MAKTNSKEENKQIALDFEVDPNKIYKFRLLTPREGRVLIQKESEIIDDVTGRKRKIRLHPDSSSPFLDDQLEAGLDDKEVPSTPTILFSGGSVTVQGYDEPLVRYLLAHGSNVARKKQLDHRNKELLFELVDYQALAQKELNTEEEKLDAKILVRQKFTEDPKQLEYFMLSRFGIKNEEETRFKTSVYAMAEKHAGLFLQDLNNIKHKIKYDITEAIELGHLKVNSKGEVTWSTGTIVGVFEKDSEGKVADAMSVWVASNTKGVKEFKELLEQTLTKAK